MFRISCKNLFSIIAIDYPLKLCYNIDIYTISISYGGKIMGSKIVKYNTYRLIDSNYFELPLPFRFDILKKDIPIASYEITEDEQIVCNIITKYKEDMLTSVRRPLSISDIYFLFSCRVFQDMTPYTAHMLSCIGLEKYNIPEILYRTHGIIPYDNYWIRFDGEEINYEQAKASFDSMMEPPVVAQPYPAAEAAVSPNLNEILNQHTIDISGLVSDNNGTPIAQSEAENKLRTAVAYSHPEQQEEEVVNNKMSESEIEALLMTAGISSPAPAVDSGSSMSQADIEAMFAVNSTAPEEPSGGQMSQADIEAMFAGNAATSAPVEETPAADDGKMSQDDIAALFAANAAAEPEPAPAVEEAPASGGKMSQDDIAALFAANAAAEPEPAPAVEEAPASGGKMSQDDIAALFAANAAAEPEPAPAVEEAPAASGGKMSQDEIAALLAVNAAAEPEPAPAVEEAPASGGKMSQDDIAALFAANAAAEPEPAPVVEEAPTSGGKMSQDDIAALFAANAAAEPEPAPAVEEAPASGGKMSQDAIEALLSGMQDEVNK